MATIIGNNRSNTLRGTRSDDIISGRGGNDRIDGDRGDDLILGEDGNDRIDGDRGSDIIDGGRGNDNIDGGRGDDFVLGGDGNDRIDGDRGNDIIDGGSGSDVIDGGRGDDLVLGGDGDDRIDGGSGNDSIDGGSGDDVIEGGSGSDQIFGDSGNDIVDGGSGNDSIDGGSGNDIAVGGSGDDSLNGGSGNDFLFGGSGDDALIGGTGSDLLTGGSGSDRFGFLSASESPSSGGWDRITDFTQGRDKIDLSELLGSADLTWGDRTPTVNGVWYQNLGFRTFVFADDNGDGKADLTIELWNTFGLKLTPSDFIGVGTTPTANHAPVITSHGGGASAALSVAEDTMGVNTVTATDPDAGDTKTFSIVSVADGGGADGAKFTIDPSTGVLSFISAPNFEAPTDADGDNVYNVTVKVTDGGGMFDTQAIAVTVTNANDAPVAGGDVVAAGTEDDVEIAGTVPAATDADDEPLTYALVGAAPAGVSFNPDGSFTVAPLATDQGLDAGESREVSFQYVANDGSADSAPATVTVTINGANDAPVSTNDSETTTAGTAVILGLDDFGSYSDPEGTAIAAVRITTLQSDGRLEHKTSAGGAWTAVALNEVISAADISAGWLRFVPDGNESGSPYATVGFQVGDGNAFSASSYTLTLNVSGPSSAPPVIVYSEVTGEVWEDDGDPDLSFEDFPLFTMGLLGFNDPDPSDTHDAITTADASNTLGGTLSTLVIDNGDGTGTVDWTYEVANADVQRLAEGETADESFTLQVVDNHGASDSEIITVTVNGLNDLPVITSGGAADAVNLVVAEDTTAVTDVDASDVDNGSVLEYLIVGGADWARFSIDLDTGVLVFNAAPDFESPTDADGNNRYELVVQVFDKHNAIDTQAITVTVVDNDPPVTADDNIITNVLGDSFNIPEWALLANDSDPDGDVIDVRDDGTIANSATGGFATHVPGTGTAGYVQFILQNEEGGSFNYRAFDQWGVASSSPGATVNVLRDMDSATPDLDGTANDDILVVGPTSGAASVIGMGGNDILIGAGGDDTLDGGAGDDILQGGAGSDMLAGGDGSDLFDYNTLADAGDAITDFSKADGDVLDLHDLMASLDIPGGSGNAFDSGYLRFTPANGDTLVEVSFDGDAGSFVTLVTVNNVLLTSTDTGDFIL